MKKKINYGFAGGALFLLAMLVFSSCAKQSSMSSSRQEELRKLSLQIESSNSYGAAAQKNDEANVRQEMTSTEVTNSQNTEVKTTIAPVATKKAGNKIMNTIIAKKAAKMANKLQDTKKIQEAKKAGSSGLNENIKKGLIIILIGLIVAIVLGALVGFEWVGAIIIVIGLIFLVMGLLEM